MGKSTIKPINGQPDVLFPGDFRWNFRMSAQPWLGNGFLFFHREKYVPPITAKLGKMRIYSDFIGILLGFYSDFIVILLGL